MIKPAEAKPVAAAAAQRPGAMPQPAAPGQARRPAPGAVPNTTPAT
jgi:hypothetical protein